MKNNTTKPLLIILEGVDGAGKSTVAQILSSKTGLPIEHHGPVKNLEEGKKEYFDFVNGPKYSVIKDRFAMGEVTYSQIYRGYKADYMKELEDALKEKYDVHLFFITGKPQFLKNRLESRGEDFLKIEDLENICNLCNDYYENSSLPKSKLNAEAGSHFNANMIFKTVQGKIAHEALKKIIKKQLQSIGGEI